MPLELFDCAQSYLLLPYSLAKTSRKTRPLSLALQVCLARLDIIQRMLQVSCLFKRGNHVATTITNNFVNTILGFIFCHNTLEYLAF